MGKAALLAGPLQLHMVATTTGDFFPSSVG